MSTVATTMAQAKPYEIGLRLSDSFEAANDLPRRFLPWVRDHQTAIKAAREALESPLTSDVNTAFEDAQREGQTELTPREWCDLLESQVRQLRELEGADPDIAEPDAQARVRLVKLAGMAIAFADVLDQWKAKREGSDRA